MKKKKDSGEVVVEASIVVTIALIFITVMLFIGIALYQQTLLTAVANHTAVSIAQVYSNSLKDPFTGYVDVDGVYDTVTYNNMKDDAYISVLEQKATALAKYRLKSSSLIASEISNVDVQIVKKANELLKSQIVVTIRDKYSIPLVGIFGNNDSLVSFVATGRADCVDLLEYLNGVEAIGDPEGSNITNISENYTVNFVSDRATGKIIASVDVEKGMSILSSARYTHSKMPVEPRHSEKTFSGWVDSSNRAFLATTVVNSDMTVYALWKCDVTLCAEGGKFSSGDTYKFTVNEGARTNFSAPHKDGYALVGWFTEKNGNGVRYFSNDTPITKHISLYAFWQCTHDYKLKNTTIGTCKQDRIDYYECIRCSDKYEENHGKGDHNFIASGITGDRCYNRYYTKKCEYCGEVRQGDYAGGGKHTYEISSEANGRCKTFHPCSSFRCTSQGIGADGKYRKCGTTTMNHFTCRWCGSHYIYYMSGIKSNVMRCGTHGLYFYETGCGSNGEYK